MSNADTPEPQHGVLLGRWVRERRQALRLTGEQVAERMGDDIPGNYVVQLENGGIKRMVGQPRLGQLARALGVAEIDLVRAAGLITDDDADAPDPDPVDDWAMLGAEEFDEAERDYIRDLVREHISSYRRLQEKRRAEGVRT